MRKTTLFLAAALSLGVGSTAVHAQNTFLVQADDLTDTLAINTYENGTLIQNAVIGGESYPFYYGLAWDPNSYLTADTNVAANIVEPGGALSDTWNLYGAAGDGIISIPFNSDVEGGSALTPLANAVTIHENGQWQTVAQFTLTNGDAYTWQFRSDAGVPEPASWALALVGLGGLGAAMRSRRKAALA